MEEQRAEPMVVEIYTVDPTLTMEQRLSWPDSDRCLPGLGPSVVLRLFYIALRVCSLDLSSSVGHYKSGAKQTAVHTRIARSAARRYIQVNIIG
jgi:hypothetical protein